MSSRSVLGQRRRDIADTLGHYWREYAPRFSTAWLFGQLSIEDRADINSACWRKGAFQTTGAIDCTCIKSAGMRLSSDCQEEILCDLLACLLLVPPGYCVDESIVEADDYQLMPDKMAVRRALEPWLDHLRRYGKTEYYQFRTANPFTMPDGLYLLAAHWGITKIETVKIASEGMSLPSRTGTVIMLRQDQAKDEPISYRQRFVIGHEVAHAILGVLAKQ